MSVLGLIVAVPADVTVKAAKSRSLNHDIVMGRATLALAATGDVEPCGAAAAGSVSALSGIAALSQMRSRVSSIHNPDKSILSEESLHGARQRSQYSCFGARSRVCASKRAPRAPYVKYTWQMVNCEVGLTELPISALPNFR
jgi:hypothetical protein